MTVTGAATLHWLPQETILFDGAGFSRHLDVQMDESTNFLASEMMVFGRTAMQETVRQGRVRDQWRIWRGGRLIHAEAFRLDGQIMEKLHHKASAPAMSALQQRYISVVMLKLKLGRCESFLIALPMCKRASAWKGKLVIRNLSNDTAGLKKLLAQFIEQFRQMANPRVWN